MFNARKFAEFILSTGLNQNQLANKMGYTRAYINYFIAEKPKEVSDEFLERFSKATHYKRELCYAMAGKLTPEARNDMVKDILDQYE